MRNFLFFTLLCVLAKLQAQEHGGIIGVKAGTSISSFKGDSDSEFSSRASFLVGAMIESKISERLFLHPEFVLSSQGAKYKHDSIDEEYRLSYINIPILIGFQVSERICFVTGPQLGVLLSAKGESEGQLDQDIKSFFNDTDLSLSAGLSYKFLSGLNLSVRYNLGLKNIVNSNLDSFRGELKNRVFQVALGYYFKNRK
ncbi:porin family protein [Aestuariibaculum marinum]|uniref:PorT family protein n=1 Tax=Aestuariibaculum marinum TaxID=2683592 RepID=A0A8J6PXV7_9FLAO|nr:porin family protein [Aestuariibaculum marinum]MBD0823035.1 PorT family protein [Aestuariibaculum marinum]